MTLRGMFRAWNEFFFTEQSPIPIALFRIFYGVMVIATLILLRPDWLSWYGVHSWVSLPTAASLEPGTRLNIFSIIPPNNSWIERMFWVRGVADFFSADEAFMVRSSAVPTAARALSNRLGVGVLDPDDYAALAATFPPSVNLDEIRRKYHEAAGGA